MKITFSIDSDCKYIATAHFDVDGIPHTFEEVSVLPICKRVFRRRAERKLKWHLEYNRTKIRPKYALSI